MREEAVLDPHMGAKSVGGADPQNQHMGDMAALDVRRQVLQGSCFYRRHLPYQPSSCTLPDTAIPGESKREQKAQKLGKSLALESPKEDPCFPWPSGLFFDDRGGGWGPGLWSLSDPTVRGGI